MTSLPNLQIAGYETLSTVDWPGHLCSTIFCQGCPWHCTYCFNKEIIRPRTKGSIPFSEVLTHLNKRKGILQGVVFSGGDALLQGETTLQSMQLIKDMGFEIGLHCDGAFPSTLEKALPLLSWVGMDIKALPHEYEHITMRQNSGNKAFKSLDILLDSDIPFECRTTLSKDSIQAKSIFQIANLLASKGVKEWHLQNAQGPQFEDTPEWRKYLYNVENNVKPMFEKFSVRI